MQSPPCGAGAAPAQDGAHADALLARLRVAVMTERLNIARWEALHALAEELARQEPACFDARRFEDALDGNEAAEAFREDLRQASSCRITRFPALLVSSGDGPRGLLIGYRPYEVLRGEMEQFAPHLAP